MKPSHSLRKLSGISDKEKQQLFIYIFPSNKERSAMVRLLRDDNSLTEKKIILSAFPELQTWLFRGPDDEGVWIGRTMLGFAHYLRATRWLRSHGFEVPMGVFKQPSH